MRGQETGRLWSYNDIKIYSKGEFVSLKLHRDYSNLLTLSNVGKFIRTCISKSRKREKKCVTCLRYCIIAVTAVWESEFYSLRYLYYYFILWGVSEFSRYWRGLCFLDLGYPGYQRFFLKCDRGAFHDHKGHFLRLDRNWKPRMKSLWHPGKIWGV